MNDFSDIKLSRRDVLKAGALSATTAVVPSLGAAQGSAASLPSAAPVMVNLSINVNGQPHQLAVDTRTTLLDLLREHLHLTGTKKGCDHGQSAPVP